MAEEKSEAKRAYRDRSDEVLAFIKQYVAQQERPPTYREILLGTGLQSLSGVYYYLGKLNTAGKIKWAKNSSRGITVIDGQPAKDDPLLKMGVKKILNLSQININIQGSGFIWAKVPTLNPASDLTAQTPELGPEFMIEVPQSYLPSGLTEANLSARVVTGTSMIEHNVSAGDIVIIHETEDVKEKEMVAAHLTAGDPNPFLKYIHYEDDLICFLPKDPKSPTGSNCFRGGQVKIIGKVLLVIRSFGKNLAAANNMQPEAA